MKQNLCPAVAAMVVSLATLAAPGITLAATPQDAATYVANDRVAEVRDLLASGWNPNILIKGQPAIMQAVRDGAWRVFDVLAASTRTDVNMANSHDETPLMYLAIQGQTQRAEALIARGAKVNRLGWTPLHYAASKGQMDVAKLLIAHKAIVNAPGPDGTTPLMMAGLSGSSDMVQLLLHAGADPSMRNTQGLDAAAWARSAKHEALAAQLDQAATARRASLAGQQGGDRAGTSSAAPAQAATPSPQPQPQPANTGSSATGGERTLQGVGGVQLEPDRAAPSR
jgi:ankyrin repeat protein